ncbi:unnamed protein product [Mytilus coruscus]|uniref:Protein kinase domain-containing protein n=1 Tax=Mytilus coruscus TaxID=42192 RepID=A0A6J8BIK2_MYTCO|nr:unnamed protein product [Mytilus coruscus]
MATPDQARYARCRLVLGDVLTQIMREYMEQSGTQPTSIERSILGNKTFRDRLNQKEMSVIQTLPTAGFKNFDISLMYKIARNKSFSLLISDKPTRGWGANPQQNECTVGDNMERIRLCRDHISHMADPSLPEVYSNDLFSKFIDIARRAEQHLQTKKFEHKILQYQNCILDKEMEDKFTKMEEEYTQQIKDLKKLLETQVKSDLPLKVYMDQSTQTVIEDMKAKGLAEGSMKSTITFTGIEDAKEKADLLNSRGNDISTESIKFEYAEEGSLVLFVEIAIGLLQNDSLLHREMESFIQHVFEVADLQCFSTEQCIAFFSILEENWESASDEDSSSQDEPLKDLVLNVEIKKDALLSEESLSQSVQHFLGKVVSGMNGQPIIQQQEITAVVGIQETETYGNFNRNADREMNQHSHDATELKLNETSENDGLRSQENKDENITVIQQGQEWIRTGPNFRCNYTVDELNNMGILELSEILVDNKIVFDNLETKSEMRDLILFYMRKGNQSIEEVMEATSTDKVFSTAASQQGAEAVEKILETDVKRKQSLYGLYGDIEKFMSDDRFEYTLKEEMTTEFGDVLSEITSYKDELIEEQCPIVVAGETAAGKSSLINLLLGSDILPQSLLTCTYTVCRIWNKEERAVYVTDLYDYITKVDLPSDPALMKETLHKYVNVEGNKYKYVDVHLPFPILKSHAIIVDTPGIGSSEELNKRLLDYLPKAIAFIYVINSSNAGGVQSDRLLQIFEMQKREGKMYNFDPTTTIFVCNKWDQVPDSEDKLVWDHILKKLQINWPNFKETQMFRLSVKMETRRASIQGLEYTSNFQKLLTAINEMIPASLEAKAARHARWQNQFLEKALKRIVGRIKLSRKTEDEKKKLKINIEERIQQLRHNIKEVKHRVLEEAEFRCQQISTELYAHLTSKKTSARIFLWSIPDLPTDSDFQIIEYKAKKMILDRINSETREWCTKENVNNLTQELCHLFKAECKLIDEQCEEINRILLDINTPLEEGVSDKDEGIELMNDGTLFTTQNKIILAITAPLWFPLALAVGLIAIPIMTIKNTIEQTKKINDYKSNKLKYMMDWSMNVLRTFNKQAIFRLMEETYLKDFNIKVSFVCENVFPLQIKADEQFVSHIKNDIRSSLEIRKQYQPLELSCKSIMGKLLLVTMDYFSGYKLSKKSIRDSTEEIGDRQFSHMHAAEVLIKGQWVRAAVKTSRKPLEKAESYIQLTEVQNLRKLHHPNIVMLYGVTYKFGTQSKKFLQIYMEYCDDSLEEIVQIKRDPPPCHKFKDISLCKESWEFYIKMACGICRGLVHIHSMGFVHRNLQLATVLVKNGEAKIAGLGIAREDDDILDTFTQGLPSTMAPEILKGELYGPEADIYSVGIILWEIWYGRPGYTHLVSEDSGDWQSITKHLIELSNIIIQGARPDFEDSYSPPNKLQSVMKKCWNDNIKCRPVALEIYNILVEMTKEFR